MVTFNKSAILDYISMPSTVWKDRHVACMQLVHLQCETTIMRNMFFLHDCIGLLLCFIHIYISSLRGVPL